MLPAVSAPVKTPGLEELTRVARVYIQRQVAAGNQAAENYTLWEATMGLFAERRARARTEAERARGKALQLEGLGAAEQRPWALAAAYVDACVNAPGLEDAAVEEEARAASAALERAALSLEAKRQVIVDLAVERQRRRMKEGGMVGNEAS